MPRKIKTDIDTRTARLALAIAGKPYWTKLLHGVFIGYRRNKTNGVWTYRLANGKGGYMTGNLPGVPDDFESANDDTVLNFIQACDRVRALGRGKSGETSKPASLAAALDRYQADLKTRGGATVNATRVRNHLTPALLAKPVALIRATELRAWRDALLAKVKPATVRRTCAVLKAALNLAADLDPRITDRSAWKVGLSGIKQTNAHVSRIISDAEVRLLVAGAYELDRHFGLFVDTLASTGTRTSQATRLLVGDLQNGNAPRLMMPSSRKGGKGRVSIRRPVSITPTLAAKLKAAAGGRAPHEPLLLRADGTAWNPNSMELCKLFAQVAKRVGVRETSYCLRHSSIVRSLIAGVPVRITAANHDTSTTQLERVYSAFISDHSDQISRRGLIDTSAPAEVNVIPLDGRR
jgi:hypothetical protein